MDATSLEREFVGDDDAVPLSSSTRAPLVLVFTERFSGWIDGVARWMRLASGMGFGEDVRDSFRLLFSAERGNGDDSGRDNEDR